MERTHFRNFTLGRFDRVILIWNCVDKSCFMQVKNKVKDWLFLGSRHLNHLDVKVDSKALDIICYLAKETVAEVVDLR